MCSLAAATQGMDETANNGALPIYPDVCDLFETYPGLGLTKVVDSFLESQ